LEIYGWVFYKYAAPTALVLQITVRQIMARRFSKDGGRFSFFMGSIINPASAIGAKSL
jgi:hypothetical protein